MLRSSRPGNQPGSASQRGDRNGAACTTAGQFRIWLVCGSLLLAPINQGRAFQDASTEAQSSEVNQAGFSLKAAGPIELNNWNTETQCLRFNFSIERADHAAFRGLAASNIQASLDANPIAIQAADLEVKNVQASNVFLVIDASGSMKASRTAGRPYAAQFDKLSAAKSAIDHFLAHLRPEDQVAVIAFDLSAKMICQLSSDKAAVANAVNAFQIASPGSKYTALYSAMEFALGQARALHVRNLVVLTDGMEDTPPFRALSRAAQERFKRKRESEIAELARSSGDVRIYTIGVGDRRASEQDLAYVDFETLDWIARRTNSGEGHYVDVPELAAQAKNNPEQYHADLVAKLQDILSDISQSFHYDYTLVLRPDHSLLRQDGLAHEVEVVCSLGRVQLPVKSSYTWARDSDRPSFGRPRIQPAFYSAASQQVTVAALSGTYLFFLLLLWILALIPMLVSRPKSRPAPAPDESHDAVVTLDKDSPYIGRRCPNGDPILEGQHIIICPNPQCAAVYHLGCWQLGGYKCWNRNCARYIPIGAAVLRAYGVDGK